MKSQAVDRFVVLNIAVSPRTERHVNDFAITLLEKEDIIPFGSVHPDSENALAELERLKKAGVRERCAKLGFIMLFHGGADRGFSPPVKTEPKCMRRVALRFPEAKIVVAHLGGQDMQEEAVQELADTNVFIDTSFSAISVDPSVAERSIRAFGADRVLFGTDCPWDTPADTVAFLSKMRFSPQEYDKIYWRNALKLLGE